MEVTKERVLEEQETDNDDVVIIRVNKTTLAENYHLIGKYFQVFYRYNHPYRGEILYVTHPDDNFSSDGVGFFESFCTVITGDPNKLPWFKPKYE